MKTKNKKNYIVVIPARYDSTRLPGKLLIKLRGKTVLQNVWEKCVKSVGFNNVIVAAGDNKIYNFCKKKKIKSILIKKKCLTGTDRVFEVSKKIKRKYYINVQGDEIFLKPRTISKVIHVSKKFPKHIINCMAKIKSAADFKNPSVPKVVTNNKNDLLYMSRAPIPGSKKMDFNESYRQVCVYLFSKKILSLFGKYKKKSNNEKVEDIEILRFLDYGLKIKMVKVAGSEISLDTYQDLKKIKKKFKIA